MTRLALAAILPFIVAMPSAHAAVGEWVSGDHVRMRLVSPGPAADGSVDAVIEIELDPNWKTYWRSAGEAGIPPELDFSGSSNVGAPEIAFPAPERAEDEYATSYVYHNRVALPVRFTAERNKPVQLQLKASLGVCADICMPVRMETALQLYPGEEDAVSEGILLEARAALPGAARPGDFAVESLNRTGGTDELPEFEAIVASSDAEATLLFVEAPAGSYPTAPARSVTTDGKLRFRFTVDRKSADKPLAGTALHFTLTQGDAAVEQTIRLDSLALAP